MAMHKFGFEVEQYLQPVSGKESRNAIQTTAEIVMALAAVFAVIAKGGLLAWALFSLIVVVLCSMHGWRVLTFFRVRALQEARDKTAETEHAELLTFARRFSQFTNSGDSSNLRYIVFNACGGSPEKCAQVCPPDYMHDLCPFLLQDFEKRSKNEREFLLATQKLYGYIASYNKEYVIEPFRKIRMKNWPRASDSSGLAPGNSCGWIESLPPMYRENTERQIEDFRERWALFLDDAKKWLEKMNETFGGMMPSYFERPQKL